MADESSFRFRCFGCGKDLGPPAPDSTPPELQRIAAAPRSPEGNDHVAVSNWVQPEGAGGAFISVTVYYCWDDCVRSEAVDEPMRKMMKKAASDVVGYAEEFGPQHEEAGGTG